MFIPVICYGQTWQQVSKRTKAQKTAGFSGGEGCQMIFSIAYAPSNPYGNVAYFVTDTTQVWKSIDGGTSWQRKSNGFKANGGLSLAVDPTNENIVYVAGSVMATWSTEVPGSIEGIFRTADGGDTWTLVKQAHFHRGCPGGILFAFAGSAIYSGPSTGGLLKSTNGGTSWSLVPKAGGGNVLDTSDFYDIKVHPEDNTILYACTNNGFYKIVDSGGAATVTTIGNGLPRSPTNVQIDKNTPTIMYACLGASGVYRSTDGGLNFTARNNGLSSTLSLGGYAEYMAISLSNPNKLIVTFNKLFGKYVFYTNDGGANWYQTSNMDEQNADGWIAGSIYGWTSNLSGVDDARSPISFHPSNSNIALTIGFSGVVKKTTDGGVTWKYSNTGYTGRVAGKPSSSSAFGWDSINANQTTFFLADFGPMITSDNEDTSKHIGVFYNGRQATFAGAMRGDIIVSAVGPDTLQRIHVSRNLGSNWTPIAGADENFTFVSFHPQNSNIVYAGKYKFTSIQTNNNFSTLSRSVKAMYVGDGNIVYSHGWINSTTQTIYKSTDGGDTWTTPYPTIAPGATYPIGQIAISPTDENRIYVSVKGKGIYIINNTSANGGTASLKNDAHGLAKDQFDEININSVTTDPINPNVVYAGTYAASKGHSNGVFRSIDAGATWTNISYNLGPEFNVVSMSVNPHNRYIYLGSFAGTWKLPPPGAEEPAPPSGGLPSVTTGTATSVGSSTATMQAVCIPNYSTTTVSWKVGTVSETYTLQTGSVTVSSSYGTSSTNVSTSTTSLSGSTTYYVKAFANNGSGTVSGSQTSFTTQSNRYNYDVEKVGTTTITVNGDLSEWTLDNSILKVTSGTVTNNIGTWSAKWNNNGLYVAIQVNDSTLFVDSGGAPWMDDGVELYIDRDHNQSSTYDIYDRHFVWNAHGTWTYVDTSNGGTSTGVIVGTSSAGSLYGYEIFVPWSNFSGGSIPDDLSIIGLDIQTNDDNNGGAREGSLTWNNYQDTNFYRTNDFGNATLQPVNLSQQIVQNVPTMWLKFDEQSGNSFYDSSGNNRSGTATAGTTATSTARLGWCRYYDGIDDQVDINSYVHGGSHTVSLYFNNMTSDSRGNLYGYTAGWNYNIYVYNNNSISMHWLSTDHVSSTTTLETNRWYHYAATINNGTMTHYIDGVANGSFSGADAYTYAVRLGRHDGGYKFKGYIDDLMVWHNSALTASEIFDLYTVPTATSGIATNIGISIAKITATCSTGNGSSTSNYYVKYGTSTTLYTGSSTTQTLTGSTTSSLDWDLSGLPENTTIYYVVTAYDTFHSIDSSEQSFTTLTGSGSAYPVGTVTINNGTYTTSQGIILSMSATDDAGINGYYLSEEITTPLIADPNWVLVGTTTNYSNLSVPFTLTTGDGLKTVNCWFKNINNIGSQTSDSITLDTTFPTVSINSPSANAIFSDLEKAYGTSGSTLSLTGSSMDTNLVTQIKVSNSATSTVNTLSGTDTFSHTGTLTPGVDNQIYVTGWDAPGNQGTDTIHVGAFPVPETGEALSVTRNSASLTGTVTINDAGTTTVWVDYGAAVYNESTGEYEGYEAGSYPGSSTSTEVGTTSTTVSIQLADLLPNTQYRYRLVGENDIGKTYALTEGEFTTLLGITLPDNHINYRGWYRSSRGIQWLKSQGLWLPFIRNVRSTQDWQDLLANPSEYLGEFEVYGVVGGQAGQATNPNPVNGATNVSTTLSLTWVAGANTDSHDIYFGTTSPGVFQGNQTVTLFNPGALDYDTTYYWRVDEVNNQGTTQGTIWSFTTESPPSTDNLALYKPVFASSIEASQYAATFAADGNALSRWASSEPPSDPQWIYVDLGAAYNIDQVVLKWEVAYGKAYQIQVSSDGQTWQTVFAETNGNGGIDDIALTPIDARYVRVYGTQRGTQYGYSLWEFEVYGVVSG